MTLGRGKQIFFIFTSIAVHILGSFCYHIASHHESSQVRMCYFAHKHGHVSRKVINCSLFADKYFYNYIFI